MRKNIKNYTSGVPIVRIVQAIEDLLVKRMNAKQFFKEYDNGELVGIVFILPTDKGDLPFKMPARVDKVMQLIGNEEQARRTAWKNIYDWIDAQIAIIETEQVKIEEVFLPYMTNKFGKTFFEIMEKKGFEMPQLEEGKVVE